jgi:hypothetical protein
MVQRQQRLALWSITTREAPGFVAVTPMRWPGNGGAGEPRTATPATMQPPGAGALVAAAKHLSTPARGPAGSGPGAGTFKK